MKSKICKCGKTVMDGKSLCECCHKRTTEKRLARLAQGLCKNCNNLNNGKTLCELCSLKHKICVRKRRHKIRLEVFAHYGNKCNCCDLTDVRFLTIDHINNDGHEHRKQMNGQRDQWIMRNNFPDTLQLLCWNCNCAKHLNGGVCPHQDKDCKYLADNSHLSINSSSVGPVFIP